MAHLYSDDDFRQICPTLEVERRMVAAENDYLAVSVARSLDRFIGFYSVNPPKEYAFDELQRCRANPNLTGLKLHLPTCEMDLDNRAHAESLRGVLPGAAENRVPVLLHWTEANIANRLALSEQELKQLLENKSPRFAR